MVRVIRLCVDFVSQPGGVPFGGGILLADMHSAPTQLVVNAMSEIMSREAVG